MRVGLFSDIHGNLHALERVLEDLQQLSVDRTVCLGDTVNPLGTSKDVWDVLKNQQIPVLRGNHEDYIVSFYENLLNPLQFAAVAACAPSLKNIVPEINKLPFSMTFENLYLCHASPLANNKSYIQKICPDMEKALLKVDENFIVGGHMHEPWEKTWKDKTLWGIGSVGLPLQGRSAAQYAVVTKKKSTWSIEHFEIEIDQKKVAQEYEDSGLLKKGAPLSYLLHEEMLMHKKRIAPFFVWMTKQNLWPQNDTEWFQFVEEFRNL